MSKETRAASRGFRQAKPHRDVVIGYCRPDHVDGCFGDWIWHVMFHDRDHDDRIRGTIALASGPRIPAARHEIVTQFLEIQPQPGLPAPTWLAMFDTDMVPPDNVVDLLCEAGERAIRELGDAKVIIGGLCFAGGKSTVYPTIYGFRHNEDGAWVADTFLEYPEDTLVQVGGTGAACTLIHRSVLETLRDLVPGPLPYYQDLVIGGADWGEDLVFCLRANYLGAKVFVHTGIKLGHRKMVTLDEDKFREYKARADAAMKELPGDGMVTMSEYIAAAGAKL